MSRASKDFALQSLVILQMLVWGQKLSFHHDTNVCIACLQALHLWQAKWVASRTYEQVAKLWGAEEMEIYGRLLHYWVSA